MVTNKTHKLLVTSGTEAADLDAIAAGEFAVLNKKGDAVAEVSDKDEFYIVVGKASEGLKSSDFIKGKDITSVTLTEYIEPVEQEFTVTVDTPIEGLVYILSVVNKSDKEILQRRQDKRTYVYKARAGQTADDLAEVFEGLINEDVGAAYTAEATTNELVITAKSTANKVDKAGLPVKQHYLEVSLVEEGTDESYRLFGDVEITAGVEFGNGTAAQVKEIERVTQGYEGYLNQRQFPVVSYPSDVVAGVDYDILTIEYINHYTSNSVSWGEVNDPIVVTIAVESGQSAALEAIFVNYLE